MKKNILKAVTFLLIVTLLVGVLQEILTPNNVYTGNEPYILSGFDALDPDTVSVLLLGDSHTMMLTAMKFYEEDRVCAYSLASSAQPIAVSYHLLKRALKTQKPEVVVLGAENLFYMPSGDDNPGWRYILDNLPLDDSKIEMAADFGKVKSTDSMLSALLPVVKYHTRWKELTEADFESQPDGAYYSAGQIVYPQIGSNNSSAEDIVTISEEVINRAKEAVVYEQNGDPGTMEIDESAYYIPQINEENIEYLLKIQSLCKEAGAELLLISVPTREYPESIDHAWTLRKSDLVMGLAETYDISFVDMMFANDIGVDFITDTWDGGRHLNVSGGNKVAEYLKNYLNENYTLTPKPNQLWDELLEKYSEMMNVVWLEFEQDYPSYLSKLVQNRDKWDVLIAASDEYTSRQTEETYGLLEQLGLELADDGVFNDSYLAVIGEGGVEYEAYSGRRIYYNTSLDSRRVELVSSGWYTGSRASIVIDGKDYSLNRAGLNIVVVDRATGLVVDSANWGYGSDYVVHSGETAHYYRDLEETTCFLW